MASLKSHFFSSSGNDNMSDYQSPGKARWTLSGLMHRQKENFPRSNGPEQASQSRRKLAVAKIRKHDADRKQPALVQHDAFDPLLIITSGLGVGGAVICLIVGLGAFNTTPNFGFYTFQLKQKHGTSTGVVVVILANIIALFLKAPMLRLLNAHLRLRFGRGDVIRLRELNLYRITATESLFSWEGAKAWKAAPWWMMIAAIPSSLTFAFTNALIVPLLTQTWSSFEPYHDWYAYRDVPYFNTTNLEAATRSFSGKNVSLVINQLSYRSAANLSYESSVLYGINPRKNGWWQGIVTPVYSGPMSMPWYGKIPGIPYPFDFVDSAESTLQVRYYSNLVFAMDVVTKYETTGLSIGHDCAVLDQAQGYRQDQVGAYQLNVALGTNSEWVAGCNFTVAPVVFIVERARNNGTGWIVKESKIPGFSVNSTWLLPHALAIASLINEHTPFLLEYEDVSSPEFRQYVTNQLGGVYANALSALYLAYFSSIIAIPGQAPTRPLRISVWTGLFGQDMVAKTTAGLLSAVLFLSTASMIKMWCMTKRYLSAADLTNPLSTLGMECTSVVANDQSGILRNMTKTGNADVLVHRFEGIRMVTQTEPSRAERVVILAGDEGTVENDLRRPPKECARFSG